MTASFRDRRLRPAFFYRIECDPVVRFWTGLGPRHLAADAIETEGGVYYGVDFLAGAPELNLLSNGTADTLTMGINGVNQRILDLIDLDADIVQGCDVNIAFVLFEADWSIARAPYWIQGLVINKVGMSLAISGAAEDAVTHTASASMVLGYGDKRRKRPSGAYWTPDRAAVGDRGLEHVPSLDASAQRYWPPPG